MSGQAAEFLAAYDIHRVRDQQTFYEDRIREYDRSASQSAWTGEALLFLAALCGVGGALWSEHALWLGVVAAGLAASAGAVGSWADVIGFSANADMYRAARAGLANVRPLRPDPATAEPDQVADYRITVEEILLGEVRTWSQKWSRPADDR